MPGSKERMPTPPQPEDEQNRDARWIADNTPVLWPTAQKAYALQGRGALVVDLTIRIGTGLPCIYFTREEVAQHADADSLHMVDQYNPRREFVIILLKVGTQTSAYCVENRLIPPNGSPRR